MSVRGARIVTLSVVVGMSAFGVGALADDAVMSDGEDMAAYQDSLDQPRQAGRRIVDLLRQGDVAAVYALASPAVTSTLTLDEVEQAYADLIGQNEIGERTAERTVVLGEERSLYVANHPMGDGAIRFTIVHEPDGITPLVEPVAPVEAAEADPEGVELSLPFDDVWWVSEGPGDVGAHHAAVADQRHAYDFSVWHDGATYRTTGDTNDDYWAWNLPVLAPAAGTIVAVVDDVTDNTPRVEADPTMPAGNHVILQLDDDRYGVIAHLRNRSIAVAVGDRVEAGDLLGHAGNSGNSYEPHVHLHVQDQPSFVPGGGADGIPILFVDVRINGEPAAAATTLSGGTFVGRNR